MARGRYGHMIKSLIVIGDFFCLNIAYAVVCYWGGGFDGGFGVKIIWLLLNLSYFPVFSLFAKIHELRILHVDRVLIKVTQAVLCHLAVFLLLIFFLQIEYWSASIVEVLFASIGLVGRVVDRIEKTFEIFSTERL